ncbi:hypothetical protein MPER_15193, partial [Moniliophthora perniciosa FA553]
LLHRCGDIEEFVPLPSEPTQLRYTLLVHGAELAVQNWNNSQQQFLGNATLSVSQTYHTRYDISPRKFTAIKEGILRMRDLHAPACMTIHKIEEEDWRSVQACEGAKGLGTYNVGSGHAHTRQWPTLLGRVL